MLSLLFILAPFIAAGCWWMVLVTGMGEIGPGWLPALFAGVFTVAVFFFLIYGFGLIVGFFEFDPIITLEVK